jgi:hypothetical protein
VQCSNSFYSRVDWSTALAHTLKLPFLLQSCLWVSVDFTALQLKSFHIMWTVDT